MIISHLAHSVEAQILVGVDCGMPVSAIDFELLPKQIELSLATQMI